MFSSTRWVIWVGLSEDYLNVTVFFQFCFLGRLQPYIKNKRFNISCKCCRWCGYLQIWIFTETTGITHRNRQRTGRVTAGEPVLATFNHTLDTVMILSMVSANWQNKSARGARLIPGWGLVWRSRLVQCSPWSLDNAQRHPERCDRGWEQDVSLPPPSGRPQRCCYFPSCGKTQKGHCGTR